MVVMDKCITFASMDRLTAEQRSKIMASIHSKNTKPEMMVRRYLFACGFRYRVNYRRLPGTPDLVLRKYRTCIFVNGCFWHGHEGCDKYRLPKTNVDFWRHKIERNKERDVEVQHQLAKMGWHVMTVWECQLETKEKREQTLMAIEYTLNHIFLMDRERHETNASNLHIVSALTIPSAIHPYQLPEEDEQAIGMAAEDRHSSSTEKTDKNNIEEK